MDQVGSHATTITSNGVQTGVKYHATIVVEFDLDKIVLDSGGWHTVTTKIRMNQASNQFGLGYSVYQKDFGWFVLLDTGEVINFWDGMVIDRFSGKVYANRQVWIDAAPGGNGQCTCGR
jgi:hypothetical protein